MSKDITKVNRNTIFKEKRVKVNGIFINYAESGRGKTIILIHGWNNNWKGQIPLGSYLISNFRVILIDLPGFGDSGRLPFYTLETQANYLRDFVDELKIKKPIVAGHSMGAYVVSKFYNLYPDIAERIILLAPMFKKHNKEKLMRILEIFYRLARKTRFSKKLIKRTVDTIIYSYVTSKYVNMYKFDWEVVKKTGLEGKKKVSPEAYVDMGVEIYRTHADKLIENNKIPINLIFGKYDRLTNAKLAQKILEGKGKYNIIEVDNAGHILTVEKPRETAEVIIRQII